MYTMFNCFAVLRSYKMWHWNRFSVHTGYRSRQTYIGNYDTFYSVLRYQPMKFVGHFYIIDKTCLAKMVLVQFNILTCLIIGNTMVIFQINKRMIFFIAFNTETNTCIFKTRRFFLLAYIKHFILKIMCLNMAKDSY